MIFHDPDTLQFWINVFFTIAAVGVAFAFTALAVGIKELRRPTATSPVTSPVTGSGVTEVPSQPVRRAA
jgi:hypothetical protein